MFRSLLIVTSIVSCNVAQRSPYAGRRPIGYPELETTTQKALVNRFGETVTTSTERLPIEALGDRDLVNRISKLPKDKQPFWYLNWKALEAQRKNPQTYELRPSSFNNQASLNPPSLNQPSLNQPSLNQPSLNQPLLNQPSLSQPASIAPSNRFSEVQSGNIGPITNNTRFQLIADRFGNVRNNSVELRNRMQSGSNNNKASGYGIGISKGKEQTSTERNDSGSESGDIDNIMMQSKETY